MSLLQWQSSWGSLRHQLIFRYALFGRQLFPLIFYAAGPETIKRAIGEIEDELQIQLNLFENSNPKHRQLMTVIDRINSSFGQQKIKLASQDQKRVWKMKQERLSPRYTTRLSDIITIKV